MTVYVFIIESANVETMEPIFDGKEIVDVKPGEYVENLNLDPLEDIFSDIEERFNSEVFVTFVDKQYQNKYPITEKGKLELERITELRNYPEQMTFCNCDWYEFLPEFNGIENDNHYIFVTSKQYINCYDYANMLQINLLPNCYFIWGVTDLRQIVEAKCYYNLFSNVKRINQKDSLGQDVTIDVEALRWIVEHGVRQVQGLIAAGVLNHETFVQRNVPHWVLNVHSYYSDAIIRAYNLIPQLPPGEDSNYIIPKPPQHQFNCDAKYRFTILNYMMISLCKYGLEFGKITTINGNYQTVNYDFLLR